MEWLLTGFGGRTIEENLLAEEGVLNREMDAPERVKFRKLLEKRDAKYLIESPKRAMMTLRKQLKAEEAKVMELKKELKQAEAELAAIESQDQTAQPGHSQRLQDQTEKPLDLRSQSVTAKPDDQSS